MRVEGMDLALQERARGMLATEEAGAKVAPAEAEGSGVAAQKAPLPAAVLRVPAAKLAVEAPVEAVRHAAANPQAKLHHSFLALKPGAAESERTVVHELAHVLQMHTGGHVDSPLVGCVVRRGGVGGGGAACSRLLLAWAGTSGRRTPSTARTCAAPPGRLTCPSSSARPTSAST